MTVVVPIGKYDPGECVFDNKCAIPEASSAFGSSQCTLDPDEPGWTSVLMLAGQSIITGGVVSTLMPYKSDKKE